MNVIKDVLAHYDLPLLSCVGLLLFMAVFAAALFWVFREGSRDFYSKMSQLPFQDLTSDGERIL